MHSWLLKSVLCFGLALCLGLSAMVNAAPPELDGFAYTAKLSDAKTSLRQLELPIEVYEKMYRRDYGDLRIFSADGQVVPHQFSRAETMSSTQLANLTFYPFNKKQAGDNGNISIEINQKEKEATFIGREYEDDTVWIYLEYKGVRKIKEFKVTNSLLFDTFDDQKNLFIIQILGKIYSPTLKKRSPSYSKSL